MWSREDECQTTARYPLCFAQTFCRFVCSAKLRTALSVIWINLTQLSSGLRDSSGEILLGSRLIQIVFQQFWSLLGQGAGEQEERQRLHSVQDVSVLRCLTSLASTCSYFNFPKSNNCLGTIRKGSQEEQITPQSSPKKIPHPPCTGK